MESSGDLMTEPLKLSMLGFTDSGGLNEKVPPHRIMY